MSERASSDVEGENRLEASGHEEAHSRMDSATFSTSSSSFQSLPRQEENETSNGQAQAPLRSEVPSLHADDKRSSHASLFVPANPMPLAEREEVLKRVYEQFPDVDAAEKEAIDPEDYKAIADFDRKVSFLVGTSEYAPSAEERARMKREALEKQTGGPVSEEDWLDIWRHETTNDGMFQTLRKWAQKRSSVPTAYFNRFVAQAQAARWDAVAEESRLRDLMRQDHDYMKQRLEDSEELFASGNGLARVQGVMESLENLLEGYLDRMNQLVEEQEALASQEASSSPAGTSQDDGQGPQQEDETSARSWLLVYKRVKWHCQQRKRAETAIDNASDQEVPELKSQLETMDARIRDAGLFLRKLFHNRQESLLSYARAAQSDKLPRLEQMSDELRESHRKVENLFTDLGHASQQREDMRGEKRRIRKRQEVRLAINWPKAPQVKTLGPEQKMDLERLRQSNKELREKFDRQEELVSILEALLTMTNEEETREVLVGIRRYRRQTAAELRERIRVKIRNLEAQVACAEELGSSFERVRQSLNKDRSDYDSEDGRPASTWSNIQEEMTRIDGTIRGLAHNTRSFMDELTAEVAKGEKDDENEADGEGDEEDNDDHQHDEDEERASSDDGSDVGMQERPGARDEEKPPSNDGSDAGTQERLSAREEEVRLLRARNQELERSHLEMANTQAAQQVLDAELLRRVGAESSKQEHEDTTHRMGESDEYREELQRSQQRCVEMEARATLAEQDAERTRRRLSQASTKLRQLQRANLESPPQDTDNHDDDSETETETNSEGKDKGDKGKEESAGKEEAWKSFEETMRTTRRAHVDNSKVNSEDMYREIDKANNELWETQRREREPGRKRMNLQEELESDDSNAGTPQARQPPAASEGPSTSSSSGGGGAVDDSDQEELKLRKVNAYRGDAWLLDDPEFCLDQLTYARKRCDHLASQMNQQCKINEDLQRVNEELQMDLAINKAALGDLEATVGAEVLDEYRFNLELSRLKRDVEAVMTKYGGVAAPLVQQQQQQQQQKSDHEGDTGGKQSQKNPREEGGGLWKKDERKSVLRANAVFARKEMPVGTRNLRECKSASAAETSAWYRWTTFQKRRAAVVEALKDRDWDSASMLLAELELWLEGSGDWPRFYKESEIHGSMLYLSAYVMVKEGCDDQVAGQNLWRSRFRQARQDLAMARALEDKERPRLNNEGEDEGERRFEWQALGRQIEKEMERLERQADGKRDGAKGQGLERPPSSSVACDCRFRCARCALHRGVDKWDGFAKKPARFHHLVELETPQPAEVLLRQETADDLEMFSTRVRVEMTVAAC